METILLSDTETDLERAAAWIQAGEVVGMPTETVYGLAADACNPEAVKKVFAAKGRPADNPLIVHISEMEQLSGLVTAVPDLAYRLAEAGLYPVCHIRRIGYGWHPDAIPSHRKTADYIV